jgi:hypothetical protein
MTEYQLVVLGVVLGVIGVIGSIETIIRFLRWSLGKWTLRGQNGFRKDIERVTSPEYRERTQALMFRLFALAIYWLAAYLAFSNASAISTSAKQSLGFLAMVFSIFAGAAVPMTESQRENYVKKRKETFEKKYRISYEKWLEKHADVKPKAPSTDGKRS